jgi:prevent-host-death family protein
MKTISAAEANRHFSSLLREVAVGGAVTVLSRGRPVATIAPVQHDDPDRESAKLQLLGRLRQQKTSGARNWARDELYEG